jgi:repressor LexA
MAPPNTNRSKGSTRSEGNGRPAGRDAGGDSRGDVVGFPGASSAKRRGGKDGGDSGGGVEAQAQALTQRQHEVLSFIDRSIRERGYPPSVREIGDAVGLASPSSVHNHLHTLQRLGYLRRDPTKPRAIEVTSDTESQVTAERRPTRHVPLVGDVAAGTGVLAQEQVEELVPLPADFTGDGELFMLRVRGDSMIEVGILDGDFVVARVESQARNGDTVVAGIPGEEATVKAFRRDGAHIVLEPANEALQPMRFPADEVQVYGVVVTVLRKL